MLDIPIYNFLCIFICRVCLSIYLSINLSIYLSSYLHQSFCIYLFFCICLSTSTHRSISIFYITYPYIYATPMYLFSFIYALISRKTKNRVTWLARLSRRSVLRRLNTPIPRQRLLLLLLSPRAHTLSRSQGIGQRWDATALAIITIAHYVAEE